MSKEEVKSIIESKFLSAEKFSLEIEKYVFENNCNYIEAIVNYCEENSIEMESVSKLISKPLKEKLKNNASQLNYLKKTSKAKSLV
jgi:hypothetical protein